MRRQWIELAGVVVLVALLLGAAVAAAQFQHRRSLQLLQTAQDAAATEARIIRNFVAADEHLEPPQDPQVQPVSDLDLRGEWSRPSYMDSTHLQFEPAGPGQWSMRLRTAGCLGSWDLVRKVHYAGSTLLLDQPVEEYGSAAYRRLFSIRYQGHTYLIAAADVLRFEQQDNPQYRQWSLLRKSQPGARSSWAELRQEQVALQQR